MIHPQKNVIAASTPTSLASVELFVLIFCFNDKDNKLPCPNVKHIPVWLLQSGCTANNASMLKVRVSLLFAPITSDRWTIFSVN